MDNVILTENFTPGKRLDSNGVEVLFDSERLFLKYHYDSFQKRLRGNSIQDGLTDTLLDKGIVVKNWDNFEKDRIAFNQKVKLETEDLFNLKANLKYLLSDCHIDIDEKGRFFFEKGEWRLELEPVSKLSIKEIENNNSAREVKRSHIIFRFSLPTYENGSESIVPTVGSFNDPSSRLSFVFTDQWFLASSSNVRPDISSSN
ncbi:hypothetical protein LEP1GSC179_0691 [Leptospira santarosai str. MOR084]|uniref:Uncharacterized protein n=1 Tax=Leptospira santarosai str. MOR084 TaxID=1049984 RepID=A0A0E2BAU5_9LEPT|nr:hypothetical protein LEP1GSC179_0691 [Leptospira santarosai str. MOR084]